jgi:hypothetical protein
MVWQRVHIARAKDHRRMGGRMAHQHLAPGVSNLREGYGLVDGVGCPCPAALAEVGLVEDVDGALLPWKSGTHQ